MMAMLTIIKFQLIAANCPFRVGDDRTVGRTADEDGHDSVGGLGALMARIIPTVAIRALFCALRRRVERCSQQARRLQSLVHPFDICFLCHVDKPLIFI